MKEEFRKWWESIGSCGICQSEYKYSEAGKPLGNISRKDFRTWIKEFRYGLVDTEIIDENVKLATQKQKYMDSNRIERKSFREFARVSNALEDYNKKLIENIPKLKPFEISYISDNTQSIGVIQISDVHFNELIDLSNNKYDFKVASKRFKLLAQRTKQYLKCKRVLIAFTGDLMNSDRRLDELLNQSTNRAKATLLSFHILEQFIVDIASSFEVSILSVSGNESRVGKELGFSEIMATDNYDFTIFNMLKIAFRNAENIKFIDAENAEIVVNVNGSNVLFMHGLAVTKDIEKSIQQTIGKYATQNIIIDYVFIGHIHSARIGDLYARSSSMCGGNAYSNMALNLASRASQNIALFHNNKTHDVMKIDLQNVDTIEGYNIIDELMAYNAKSIDKYKKIEAIHQITI